MRNSTFALSSYLSVSGEDIINWSASVLFIFCPVRVLSLGDSELTASLRYPTLHLPTLPDCMSGPHHAAAVIHINAIRKELTHWHAPCHTGGGSRGDCDWWGGHKFRREDLVMFDGEKAHFKVADGSIPHRPGWVNFWRGAADFKGPSSLLAVSHIKLVTKT